jgi:hypothetical protein
MERANKLLLDLALADAMEQCTGWHLLASSTIHGSSGPLVEHWRAAERG